mgnify:CR=1 FL=1
MAAHTWSSLLDDLFRMRIESDKENMQKPLLGFFIEKAEEQQLSLALENKEASNLEVLFGCFLINVVLLVRQRQKIKEQTEEVNSFIPYLKKALNDLWTTLELLAQEEIKGM